MRGDEESERWRGGGVECWVRGEVGKEEREDED